jgi:SAM-dependent methyltransferase
MNASADIAQRVRSFYEALPFNYYESLTSAIEQVRRNPVTAYPDLHRLLSSQGIQSVLEFGCGTGWFSNAVALHYSKAVLGVDMTSQALERAREIAGALGAVPAAEFAQSDIFAFDANQAADLVVSIGVLHHTYDARKAFFHIQKFVNTKGWIFMGLYHAYGRGVMLRMFREVLERDGEDTAFHHFKALHPGIREETHLRSWFRDQILHPHETQHTLEEVLVWLEEAGFELASTSINQFGEFRDPRDLIPLEKRYEQISYQRNVKEGRFFPGFFTVLARRCGGGARAGADLEGHGMVQIGVRRRGFEGLHFDLPHG